MASAAGNRRGKTGYDQATQTQAGDVARPAAEEPDITHLSGIVRLVTKLKYPFVNELKLPDTKETYTISMS